MFWKKCSNCKKELAYGQPYYKCSVSTCNHERTGVQFCTVSCWSAHVPIMRHRDAWAEDAVAPKAPVLVSAPPSGGEINAVSGSAATSRSGSPQMQGQQPQNRLLAGVAQKSVSADEVLVVVSKLKAYIKDTADMNTSADVIDVLSDKLRRLCDGAVLKARQDGRKTVMARDF
jgi:hypothetical protein